MEVSHPYLSSTYSLRSGLSLKLTLMDLAQLAAQRAPRIFLSLLLWLWVYIDADIDLQSSYFYLLSHPQPLFFKIFFNVKPFERCVVHTIVFSLHCPVGIFHLQPVNPLRWGVRLCPHSLSGWTAGISVLPSESSLSVWDVYFSAGHVVYKYFL